MNIEIPRFKEANRTAEYEKFRDKLAIQLLNAGRKRWGISTGHFNYSRPLASESLLRCVYVKVGWPQRVVKGSQDGFQ